MPLHMLTNCNIAHHVTRTRDYRPLLSSTIPVSVKVGEHQGRKIVLTSVKHLSLEHVQAKLQGVCKAITVAGDVL